MHLHWTTSRGPSSCEICILTNNKQTDKKTTFCVYIFLLIENISN